MLLAVCVIHLDNVDLLKSNFNSTLLVGLGSLFIWVTSIWNILYNYIDGNDLIFCFMLFVTLA